MTEEQNDTNADTPIVAIGASAGGLKQITALLGALPDDTGAAYVVIQHLSSEHTSQLPELLSRATDLDVVAIEDGMPARGNRVHVLPEDAVLGIEGGHFRLSPKTQEPSPTIIDTFMRALARAHGSRVIGIILSGSGHDGALGLKSIKLEGGLTLVQDPETAEHPSMPRSAIDSASPDYVLETGALVEPLCNHLNHNLPREPRRERDLNAAGSDIDDVTLERALDVLRSTEEKRDFSNYKPNMLKRRLNRRMGLSGIDNADSYIRRLQDDAKERLALSQDFLISVTDFFRDAEAYAVLRTRVIPQLLADRDPADTIRVWVPGCASGEEAYSIAILLDEAIQQTGKAYKFIVFASDIDTRALETARIGRYPESIASDLPARHLRLYFDKTDDHYRVSHNLRERVVFARQNVTEDPPYSRLDLVSCRNLLMYLQTETQKRVIATFHFALQPRGFLFLGSSETLNGRIDLFETLDKNAGLFQRIGVQHAARNELPFAAPHSGSRRHVPASASPTMSHHDDPEKIARDLLLRENVPAAVLINRKLEVLCSYGPTHDFLALPFGASSLSLPDLVRQTYRSHIRALTHRAFRDASPAETTAAPHNNDEHIVRINVRPLHEPESARGLALVTFERVRRAAATRHADGAGDNEHRLADELEATRSELNTTIQALEASNEDLKGSHEEVLSMNEELQSTNEELETSKEELQSINEELTTVNTELENKVGELETAHNDLQNLFAGTNVATLFLDKGLCIKRFTPAIKDLLSLIASDVGRPLNDISLKFDDPELESDAERAMEDLVQCDKEVRTAERWYQRRILPYRTQSNTIDGVVITFADITELKQAALESAASEQRLDLAMGAINGGMWDMHLQTDTDYARPDRVYLSARLKQLLGFANDQFPDSLQAWEERVVESDRAAFSNILERRAAGAAGLHYRIRHRDGSIRWFASYGTLIDDTTQTSSRWIGMDRDITEQKLSDRHIEQTRARLQLLADAVSEMVGYIDTNETFQFVNQAFNSGFGYAAGEVTGRTLTQVFSNAAYAELRPCLDAALAGHSANCHVEQSMAQARNHKLMINHVPQIVDGQTTGVYLLITHYEQRGRRASDHFDKQSSLVYLQRLATIGEMTSTLAHDIKQPLTAINTYAGALKRMVHAGRDPDDIASALDKIADQVQHASDMVSLTRDFVVERNADDNEVDINILVHRAVALTESLARKHHIEIHLDLYTPVPAMQCLTIQIEQVIINLMVNAMDALEAVDRDARSLTLRTRPIDDHAVELSVTDTGEGIPSEKLGRVFEAFYTSKLDGTGLGLALSKTIVESHGGTIWATSKLDEGATFFVRLPAGADAGRT